MKDFSLKFSAQLRNGFEPSRAKEALMNLFNLQDRQVDSLIAGGQRLIKKNLNQQDAHKWVKLLWASGWHCSLMKGPSEVYSTIEAPQSKLMTATDNRVSSSLQGELADEQNPDGQKVDEQSVDEKDRPESTKQAHLQRIYAPRVPGSICILKGWQRQETLNPNACIQAGCQDRDAYMIVIAQPKKDIQGSPDLLGYTKAVVSSAAGFIEQGQVAVPIDTMPHRELKGLWAEITGLVNGAKVHYLISVFEGVEHFYAVYFWTGDENFASVRPLFNAMNASFSCTKTRRESSISEAKTTH